MSTVKTIAIAGASGDLGSHVLNALLEAKAFDITVLSRHSSTATFPTSVKVIHVDYDSVSELTAALQGQDGVVSTLTSFAMDAQLPLIEASVNAGVKRFIPSEFSGNIGNLKSAQLPVYQSKIAIHQALTERIKNHPNFSYTLVRNGVFLDWGLAHGFHLTFTSDTPKFYDGGDRPFSTTSVETIGKTVARVFQLLEETKNHVVCVHDAVVTQRQILQIAQKLRPEKIWIPATASTRNMEAASTEQYAKGNITLESSMGFLVRAVFGEGYGGEFPQIDNKLLGIPMKTESELEEYVRVALDTAFQKQG